MVKLGSCCKLVLWQRAGGIGLAALLMLGIALAGCAPAQPTLPPSTTLAKPPALPTLPPTAAKAPTAVQGAPTNKPVEAGGPRRAVTLTIMHTNDVRGETDPCG